MGVRTGARVSVFFGRGSVSRVFFGRDSTRLDSNRIEKSVSGVTVPRPPELTVWTWMGGKRF